MSPSTWAESTRPSSEPSTQRPTPADYRMGRPTWCPGCGDYGVLRAVQKAAAQLALDPAQTVVVGGIGCSGKLSYYIRAYAFHGLHGRALPLATGIKLANPHLTLLVAGGDGDGYGIGLGHLIHAMRRDVDLTYIVMDNHVYGLTKGQYSATSRKGFRSRSSPLGSGEEPVHPLELALAAGCGFVAQGFAGDPDSLSRLLVAAIRHPGFALVNVLSPCVTFNREDTYERWQQVLVNLEPGDGPLPSAAGGQGNRGASAVTQARPAFTDRQQAMAKVMESGGLVTGLIYQRQCLAEPRAEAGVQAAQGAGLALAREYPARRPVHELTRAEQEEYLARFAG